MGDQDHLITLAPSHRVELPLPQILPLMLFAGGRIENLNGTRRIHEYARIVG
jgi:hypothetical protein